MGGIFQIQISPIQIVFYYFNFGTNLVSVYTGGSDRAWFNSDGLNAYNIRGWTKFIVDGVIEQIDGLARIANEFSNFAKMPEQKLSSINLVQVIQTAVDLYSIRDGAFIEFNTENEEAII